MKPKKSSPRNLVIPGYPHHVILRGNNRRRLFSYSSDYTLFLYLLGCALSKVTTCVVHALCLMSNHLHLIVTPNEEGALGKFVQSVSQRYAQHRNKQKNASGKLFEQRFWRNPILSDRYLEIATAYVELNPMRAGIAADPADYPWSTYRIHTGRSSSSRVSPKLWTPSDWYRGLGESPEVRARRYAAWVQACHADDLAPEERERIEQIEALSRDALYRQYGQRIRRPDESRASERADVAVLWTPDNGVGPM